MVCFRVSPSKRSGRLRCKECSTVPPDRTRQAPIQHLPYLDKTNHIGYTLTPALASCAGRRKVGKGEAGTFTDVSRRFARAVGAAGARHGARTVRKAVSPRPRTSEARTSANRLAAHGRRLLAQEPMGASADASRARERGLRQGPAVSGEPSPSRLPGCRRRV